MYFWNSFRVIRCISADFPALSRCTLTARITTCTFACTSRIWNEERKASAEVCRKVGSYMFSGKKENWKCVNIKHTRVPLSSTKNFMPDAWQNRRSAVSCGRQVRRAFKVPKPARSSIKNRTHLMESEKSSWLLSHRLTKKLPGSWRASRTSASERVMLPWNQLKAQHHSNATMNAGRNNRPFTPNSHLLFQRLVDKRATGRGLWSARVARSRRTTRAASCAVRVHTAGHALTAPTAALTALHRTPLHANTAVQGFRRSRWRGHRGADGTLVLRRARCCPLVLRNRAGVQVAAMTSAPEKLVKGAWGLWHRCHRPWSPRWRVDVVCPRAPRTSPYCKSLCPMRQ